MVKLLSGQQLYMAESIIAQRRSESSDTPPFPPPTQELPPCIVPITNWGELLDLSELNLIGKDSGNLVEKGQRIGRASFVFPDVWSFMPRVILNGHPGQHYEINAGRSYTPEQLYNIHYVPMSDFGSVACYFGPTGLGKTVTAIYPGHPYYMYHGIKYGYSVSFIDHSVFVLCDNHPPPEPTVPFGPFGAHIVVTDASPLSTFTVPLHYHPNNSILYLTRWGAPQRWTCIHYPPVWDHYQYWS